MKKLLIASVILLLFSTSICIFQISCSKKVEAQVVSASQYNKIVYQKFNSGSTSPNIWITNYDGTGNHQLNIPTYPVGYYCDNTSNCSLSPDCSQVFFVLTNTTNQIREIFKCDTSGANLTSVVVCDNAIDSQLGGSY